MSEVTRILTAIEDGDARAADELLPIVYQELRRLAAQRLSQEPPGQTLQPTALVHEAYIRLVGAEPSDARWNSRGHFFAAAAEAMRRILIDSARAKGAQKRGGNLVREEFRESQFFRPEYADEYIELDESLTRFEEVDADGARLVKLRFYAGLTGKEAAAILGISPRKADQIWAFARAWLREDLGK
jgi:RNA polymerase sigma factor (TIGR02999 family)